MKFALHSKTGDFIANVETAGAFTPDVIVWGGRYFWCDYRPALGPYFREAVLDTAVTHSDVSPPSLSDL